LTFEPIAEVDLSPKVQRVISAWQQWCDCIESGNAAKPKQHGADPHAKNCAVYKTPKRCAPTKHRWVNDEHDWGTEGLGGVRMVRICTICGHMEGRCR
jgi:hypothetical protein